MIADPYATQALHSHSDAPVWVRVVAVAIVALAVFCAVRHSYRALTTLVAIARRKTPARLLWALRSIQVPPIVARIMCIALVYIGAAALGAGVTTLALARGADSRTATVPMSVSVPVPALTLPGARPSVPVTFVHAIVPALERQGLTRTQAVLFAAHLARETGWGRWVRGNNFGNIKRGGWSGESFQLIDRLGFLGTYRAYPSVDEGLRDAVALIRNTPRYRRAWRLLQAGDSRWYGQLGLDGYYEGPTGHARDGSRFHTEHDLSTVLNVQREYDGIVALVRNHSQ